MEAIGHLPFLITVPGNSVYLDDQMIIDSDELNIIENAPAKKGDLDKDGEITIVDVRLLLQVYINSSFSTIWTEEQLDIMDMNNDSIINIIDVRLLLQ